MFCSFLLIQQKIETNGEEILPWFARIRQRRCTVSSLKLCVAFFMVHSISKLVTEFGTCNISPN